MTDGAPVLSWLNKPYSEPLNPEDCCLWLRYLGDRLEGLDAEFRLSSDTLAQAEVTYQKVLRRAVMAVRVEPDDGPKMAAPERLMKAELACEAEEDALALARAHHEALKARWRHLDRTSSNVQSVLGSLKETKVRAQWAR